MSLKETYWLPPRPPPEEPSLEDKRLIALLEEANLALVSDVKAASGTDLAPDSDDDEEEEAPKRSSLAAVDEVEERRRSAEIDPNSLAK